MKTSFLTVIILSLIVCYSSAFAQEQVEIYNIGQLIVKQVKGKIPVAELAEGTVGVELSSLPIAAKSYISTKEADFFKVERKQAFISKGKDKKLVFVTTSENSSILNDCYRNDQNCNPIIKVNNERVFLNLASLSEENKKIVLQSSVLSELKANVQGYYKFNKKQERVFNIIAIEFLKREVLDLDSSDSEEVVVSAKLY